MGIDSYRTEWGENVHTVIGELMHKKVHDPYLREKRKDNNYCQGTSSFIKNIRNKWRV